LKGFCDVPPVITGSDAVADADGLEDLVTLDQVDGAWRNRCCLLNVGGQVLGGQLAAHCLMAAAISSPDSTAHTLQLAFVQAANPKEPFHIKSADLRSGRRLSHRSVHLGQAGQVVATALVTLQSRASPPATVAWRANQEMPHVPPPEHCEPRSLNPSECDPLVVALAGGHPYLEIRSTRGYRPGDTQLADGRAWYWLRVPLARNLAPAAHYALLTLASDFWFTLPVHGATISPRTPFTTTSLDHTVWFHDHADLGEWLLVETQRLLLERDVGLMSARYWSRHGRPVATVMQQALIRRAGWLL